MFKQKRKYIVLVSRAANVSGAQLMKAFANLGVKAEFVEVDLPSDSYSPIDIREVE